MPNACSWLRSRKKAIEQAAQEVGAKANVTLTTQMRAAKISEDAPVVQAAKQALAAAGIEQEIQVITGGTDTLILDEKGIDAVVIGFGGEKHTPRRSTSRLPTWRRRPRSSATYCIPLRNWA